jgi:hypothetical protein
LDGRQRRLQAPFCFPRPGCVGARPHRGPSSSAGETPGPSIIQPRSGDGPDGRRRIAATPAGGGRRNRACFPANHRSRSLIAGRTRAPTASTFVTDTVRFITGHGQGDATAPLSQRSFTNPSSALALNTAPF